MNIKEARERIKKLQIKDATRYRHFLPVAFSSILKSVPDCNIIV